MSTLTELESVGKEVRHSLQYSLVSLNSLCSQVRCPVCKAGPITEAQLARIASGGASKKKKAAKPLFTSSTSSSAPGSSSQTEVLTILDSSDDDSDAPAPAAKSAKGKGKAKAIVLDSDSDDDFQPASDAKMGDLEDSDEDNAPASEGLGLATTKFRSSTKLDALVKSLNTIREADPDVKAVVFSQASTASYCSKPYLTPRRRAVHWLPRPHRARDEPRALHVSLQVLRPGIS